MTPEHKPHSEHGQRIMDLAARFTGLVDIERNARIEIVGKIAGEVVSLEEQVEALREAVRHAEDTLRIHGTGVDLIDLRHYLRHALNGETRLASSPAKRSES